MTDLSNDWGGGVAGVASFSINPRARERKNSFLYKCLKNNATPATPPPTCS